MALTIAPNLQVIPPTASDFKFVFDRSDDGEASISLQQFKVVSTDVNGNPIRDWVVVAQQANAGWDDAIPWAAGNYHLSFAGAFAGFQYSWNMTDPPTGREAIKLHLGNMSDPSGPVHGCMGASGAFLTQAHDLLQTAGVLNQSIACEVNNNFDYSISVQSASASVNEGEDTTFTVSLSDSISKNLWVRLDIDDSNAAPQGIATYAVDYVIQPNTPGDGAVKHVLAAVNQIQGRFAGKYDKGYYVEIPEGQSQVTYKIHTLNDKPTTPPEGDESINIKINDYFVEDDYHGSFRGYYSDYLLKQNGGHGALLRGALPSSPVTILDKGNLLTAHLSGGIEGLLRTFNVTKGDVITYGFQAYSIPDKLSISGGTTSVDTGGFVSDFHSGSITAAGDTITVIVVGSSAGTAWDLDLTETAPPATSSNNGEQSTFQNFSSDSMASTFVLWPDGTMSAMDAAFAPQLASPVNATLHLDGQEGVIVPTGSEAAPVTFSVQAGHDYLIRLVGFEVTGNAGDLLDGYLKVSENGDPSAPLETHYSGLLNEPAMFFHASANATISAAAGSDDPTTGGAATVQLYDASTLHDPIVFFESTNAGVAPEGTEIDLAVHRVGDVSHAASYTLLITSDSNGSLSASDLQNGFDPIVVSFDAGQSVATAVINPLADGITEGLEGAHVSIDPSSISAESIDNAALLGLSTTTDIAVTDTGEIENTVFPTVNGAPAESSESDGHIDFKVTLSATPNVPVSLSYTTFDGTAQAGLDYTPQAGTVTFAPGQTEQTISIPLIQDGVQEPDETIQLKILDPSGLYLPNNAVVYSVAGTIHDSAAQFEYHSTYDPQGRLDTATVIDHGTGNTYFTDYDQGDTFPWTTAISGYGPDGKLDYVTMKMDNGQTFYTDYNQNGSNPWAMAITGYDDHDRLDYVTTINRDGSSAYTDYDQENSRPDQYSVHFYDPSNKLVHSFVQFDNGFQLAT